MHITCAKSATNIKLIDNLMVSPDISTLPTASSAVNLTTVSGSFLTEAVIDCLCAVGDGVISVECRHTNFNSYIQIEDRQ